MTNQTNRSPRRKRRKGERFVIRGEDADRVLAAGKAVVVQLRQAKAEPRLVAANGKVKVNGNGGAKLLCPECKVEGVFVSGTSQKNGKAYSAQKCPQCQEFIPGTFRWS